LTSVSENELSREIQKVLKIFIASSTELKEEREKLIHIFNSINKYLKHLRLDAIKWETDIESGSCDKQRIQDEINPLLEDCQIVFLLLYSKIGKFTLEEYKLALKKNKKVFIYFKKGFSPENEDEIKNFEKVLQLKRNLIEENRTLYNEYENIDQFENLIRKDISLYISRNYSQAQREKTTELDEYLGKIKKITVDQEADTSAPVLGKTLKNLDEKQLVDFFELERVKAKFLVEDIDSIEEKLSHLHLLVEQKYLIKGTFLCFGKNIGEVCKSAAESKFFVFKDNERLEPIINESVRGNLITQYLKMLEHLRRNLYLIREIYSDKKEDYEIPSFILRELLANAFVHREYSSNIKSNIQVELYPGRLEIKNPGTFPAEIDLDRINEIEMSYVKNVEIAEIFFLYKFVEKAGSGIQRIQALLNKNDFKPAEFFQDKRGNYVKITVHRKKIQKEEEEIPIQASRSTTLLTQLPPRKVHLIGREAELGALAKRVEETNRAVLLNGLGGIGKTEVCKTFFMEHYKEFSFAGWIDYVSSIKESLVNSIKKELVKGDEKDTLDERFNKIIAFLQQLPPDSLLVIDNIVNPTDDDLDKIKTLPFKVIANSRFSLEGFDNLTLDFLSSESCKALFYHYYRGERHDEFVEKIVDLCGRHTLTVELLARTAQNAALPVKLLYDKLVKKGFNLNNTISEKVSTFWHNEKTKKLFFHHLLKIFDLSNVSEKELHILTNLSVLPTIYIMMNEFAQWLELETNEDINSLVFKGWLRQDGFKILMHGVAQEVIRYKTSPDTKKCSQLITSLKWKLYLEPGDNPIDKKEYVIFADSLMLHIDENDNELAALSNNLSGIYWDLGQLEKAMTFQLKAIEIREKVLDKNHPDLAVSYNNLSLIYQDTGQLEQALAFQKKALKIAENTLDKNHPSLATSYNNLSAIYKALGQLEQALEFQLKTSKIFETVLDKNHPDLATAYNNLSAIYQDLGQLEQALEFQLKTLKIFETVLDKNHPSLATSYHNLSKIYLYKEDYASAKQYAEKAVGILERLFPNGHPNLDIMKRNLEEIKKRIRAKKGRVEG